ncbi:MAG: SDR family oxidoreductase [Verrucomicrobia bacterium]|nr:SDR family oxidoreductase [Verrucomicrobiota bacterium]
MKQNKTWKATDGIPGMDLSTKTALITGGAVRIGRAITDALAAQGCAVVIHCRHSQAEAHRAVADIRAGGGEAHVVVGDLASPADCERLFAEALSAAGKLDILVNSASCFTRQTLLQSSAEAVAREFQVNLFAPMSLTRAFAAALNGRAGNLLKGAPRGHVINLLDRRVTGLDTEFMPYVLSKKSLQDFTRMAALELAPHIAVNAIAPGAILPPIVDGGKSPGEPRGEAPLDYRCSPADIVQAVLYLLSAPAVTGQTLYIDSGQNLL